MAFQRSIRDKLKKWRLSERRKPLILRGARQTGKTTAVEQFASEYPQFLSFNLERYEDRQLFDDADSVESLLERAFFLRDQDRSEDTLIFIDEIQHSSRAMSSLRYFYEDFPQYSVIAAGSLLEHHFDFQGAFPVGRVTFLYLHPVSFEEFLGAIGEEKAKEAYHQIPVPDYAHPKLLNLFHRYMAVGGMPEAVDQYTRTADLRAIGVVYSDLIQSIAGDLEKHASSRTNRDALAAVFRSMLKYPCGRITYNDFDNCGFGSTQVKESFRTLETAMLCTLQPPVSSLSPPLIPNRRRKPRLHLLDTGFALQQSDLIHELLSISNLNDLSRGGLIEHIVGQEVTSADNSSLSSYTFWAREKPQSSAEVDYLIQNGSRLIPVEVKSGKAGRLRSLMQFIDESRVDIAVRCYGGPFRVEEQKTIARTPYTLLNVPYYHAARLGEYLGSRNSD